MSNFTASTHILDGVGHEFTAEEIAYIEEQGFTLAQVRAVAGKLPANAEKITIEAALGEAAQAPDVNEPNVIDPQSPNNEVSLGGGGADIAAL